uniref:Uncharacterized protein n=1 Tax=Anguilla anguilla TaxID=7936 RepID=A0A0E9UGA6_ANGAN
MNSHSRLSVQVVTAKCDCVVS